MTKIHDLALENGDEVQMVLRLSDIAYRKTPSGEDYATMLGYDGQDKIEVKIWHLTDQINERLKNGEVYKVIGKTKVYQDRLQLNLSYIEKVGKDEGIDLESFYEKAKLSSDDLAQKINAYFLKIENKILKNIVSAILRKNFDAFFSYPAAVVMHHNYYGGLAYHTYSMLKLSDAYLAVYPFLNKDLVYAGIILHDIGKLKEFSEAKAPEYTKGGNLVGHIVYGYQEVAETALSLGVEASEEVLNLEHVLLAHHGKLEYGSPKEPMTAEALLVHLLDYSDSRLAALEKEVSKSAPGNYTQPIPAFERKAFYVPNIQNSASGDDDGKA